MSDIKKQIDKYVKGVLAEEEISELWIEFAKNPELLDELELEVGVRELLLKDFSVNKKKSKVKISQLPDWTWTAVAAGVIILVGMVQLFQVPSHTSLDQIVVNEIPADQLETSDGVRNQEIAVFEADSILNLGFNAYLSGQYDQALSLYKEVMDEFDFEPYASKAYLNTGIIYYNEGEYENAIEVLEEALSRVEESRMIEEKAHWFIGNALVNLDRKEEARNAVYNAYSLDGIFRTPAFLLLQKLNYDLGYQDSDNDD